LEFIRASAFDWMSRAIQQDEVEPYSILNRLTYTYSSPRLNYISGLHQFNRFSAEELFCHAELRPKVLVFHLNAFRQERCKLILTLDEVRDITIQPYRAQLSFWGDLKMVQLAEIRWNTKEVSILFSTNPWNHARSLTYLQGLPFKIKQKSAQNLSAVYKVQKADYRDYLRSFFRGLPL